MATHVLHLISIESLEQRCSRLEFENVLLRQKIDTLIKALYGAKSEALDPAQLALELGIKPPGKPESASGETSAPEEAKKRKTKGANNNRVKGLNQLETIGDTILPTEVEVSPDDYELIGQEVTEQLDYQPAKCFKRRTTRPKFRRKDRSAAPIAAPPPLGPFVGGLPTFTLTSELIISKCTDHLPLYRQQQIFWRNEVDIPRDTLTHWALSHLEILRPVGEAIHAELLSSLYLQIRRKLTRLLGPWDWQSQNRLPLGHQQSHRIRQLPMAHQPLKSRTAEHIGRQLQRSPPVRWLRSLHFLRKRP